MHLTPILFIALIGHITATPVCFNLPEPEPVICNCGLGSGEDVCNKKALERDNTPLVVRPLEVPKPTPAATLTPVAGPCSCSTSFVKPAVLPRPQCSSCYRASNNQQVTINSHNQQQYVFGHNSCNAAQGVIVSNQQQPVAVEEVIRNPANPAQFIAADPVSIAVALREANKNCDEYKNLEDRLWFGFRTMPKELPKIRVNKIVKAVPEEKLFNINGQIVELKKVKCSNTKSLDDEAAEELMALAEESAEARENAEEIRKVSLGEIGYAPAKISAATFVNVPSSSLTETITDAVASAAQDAAATLTCNDGFKSGSVQVAQVPQPSPVSLPVPLPPPCPSSGEEVSNFPVYSSSNTVPVGSGRYVASSCSSSSATYNNHRASQHSVYMSS